MTKISNKNPLLTPSPLGDCVAIGSKGGFFILRHSLLGVRGGVGNRIFVWLLEFIWSRLGGIGIW